MRGVTLQRPIIPAIVSQHLEDAAALRSVRSVLVRAPHVKLLHLGRTDERLLAHLDGLSVAGDAGYDMARTALDVPGVGQLFVVAVLAIERRDAAQLDRLVALLEAVPSAGRALASAFGWLPAPLLRGMTAPLLTGDATPAQRWLGITACASHGVDPGPVLQQAIGDADPRLRSKALRAAAQIGRADLLGTCLAHLQDADPSCRLAAAWSSVLLGDRAEGAQALTEIALRLSPPDAQALQLALLTADPATARHIVRTLIDARAPLRTAIQATAWAGDARAIPWLIKQMADDRHARLAGEAFSFITGADLALLDLERKPPENVDGGPTEDPADDNVALDADESLPWPDLARLQAWWHAHAERWPRGERCFVGGPADVAHCTQVLRTATQRQRHAAALLLALQRAGMALFNVAAPTHRQKRLLAAQPFAATEAGA